MTAPARSALVIQHDPTIHLGNLEPVLRSRGYEITVVDSRTTDVSALDAAEPDVLIVLGGHEAAYELEKFPYLRNDLRLIRSRIDAELPLLGVCLGAQLMAGAMGARNYRGERPDYGYRVLTLTDAGESSPLRHARGVPMLEWHGDHFELPEGARLLASSAAYPNEAFAIGDFGLGVQFHPEVTDEMHDVWTAHTQSELTSEGITVEQWRALRDEHNAPMQAVSVAMFTEWLDAVERDSSERKAPGRSAASGEEGFQEVAGFGFENARGHLDPVG